MKKIRKDKDGNILEKNEYQRDSGLYEYKYIDKDGIRKSAYSRRLTASKPKLKKDDIGYEDTPLRVLEKEILRDLLNGTIHSTKYETLNSLFPRYMELSSHLKKSTRVNYEYMYRTYVAPDFGKKDIRKIDFEDVRKFYSYLVYERGLSYNTMDNINNVVHPVFDYAVEKRLINTNPSHNILNKMKVKAKYKCPKKHSLKPKEQEAFLTYISNSPIYQHWKPIFTVLLGTGCRIGELVGLRWCDVDFKKGEISFNHNTIYCNYGDGSKMHITTPKTEAGIRTIPLTESVKNALLAERDFQLKVYGHLCEAEIEGYKGFIFMNKIGHIHNPQTLNKAIRRIYSAYNSEEEERAKREGRDPELIRHFSNHNLRHSFVSNAANQKMKIKDIQELVGHSDVKTTLDTYAEAIEESKHETMKTLDNAMNLW